MPRGVGTGSARPAAAGPIIWLRKKERKKERKNGVCEKESAQKVNYYSSTWIHDSRVLSNAPTCSAV